MKRNALIAVIVTAAATVALSGPALAKSGNGGGHGGNNQGSGTSAKPPKPTIHPNQAVKDAIHCALRCGTIAEDNEIEASD